MPCARMEKNRHKNQHKNRHNNRHKTEAEEAAVPPMSSVWQPMTGLNQHELRERVLESVTNDGRALQTTPKEFKGDREIVLAAVTQYGPALQYAAAELKADREIVLAAVAQDGMALKYAAVELRSHRALKWVADTDISLHCAKLRLLFARTIPCAPQGPRCTLATLTPDIVEMIGVRLTSGMTINQRVQKLGYWLDETPPKTDEPSPKSKKRRMNILCLLCLPSAFCACLLPAFCACLLPAFCACLLPAFCACLLPSVPAFCLPSVPAFCLPSAPAFCACLVI